MKASKKVAIGGLIAAISLIFMFLTGVFPFATFALPGIAGAFLLVPVIEMGRRQALIIYAAVALLSIFIAPDREAAASYIVLLGYYPIIKSKFEQVRSRVLEYILKILLFVLVLAAVTVSVFIFGFVFEDVKITWMMLVGGYLILLFAFLVYDFALGRIVQLYYIRLRPILLKHILK